MFVFVCMFEHNSRTPDAISTKFGTYIAIYILHCILCIYIYINGCMCLWVCSSITLERLVRFQQNLVHIWLYIYILHCILCIYGCMCLWVCMFEHNSRTPAVISTKLGTQIAIYIILCQVQGFRPTQHWFEYFIQ
jgi:hypothetical protein